MSAIIARQQAIYNSWKKHPMTWGLILMLFAGSGLAWSVRSSLPPPEVVTRHRFTVLEQRIREYHLKHGSLPPDLNALPPLSGADNNTFDGWDHPIHLTMPSEGQVILKSYGSDGIPGGYPDLIYEFNLPAS